MEHGELTDEIKEQSREREAGGELAEPVESGNTELSLDDLDGAAGGKVVSAARKFEVVGLKMVGSVED